MAMTRARVEFTVEPFVDGAPGPHVVAAIEALAAAGFEPEVGPFGTAVEGDVGPVLAALASAAQAAFDHDAMAMTVSIDRVRAPDAGAAPFLDAIRPVLRRMGAVVVAPERMRDGDEPLEWDGRVVGGVRLPDPSGLLVDAVPRLIAQVEAELGGRLDTLSREEKQAAAARLEQLGAFHLRNATEAVADALGVSRMTVYNYLSAVRKRDA